MSHSRQWALFLLPRNPSKGVTSSPGAGTLMGQLTTLGLGAAIPQGQGRGLCL